MAIQLSTGIRNARLDAIETQIGPSAVLKIRTGAAPANVAAADSGDVLATANLPSDWMGNALGGAKNLAGLWQDNAADATGTAGHFRIYASDGTTAHLQGSCGSTGSGADMELDDPALVAGKAFKVAAFTLTDGNA